MYLNNKKFHSNVLQAENHYKNDEFYKAITSYNTALKYKNDDEIKNKIKLCNKMNSSYENFINGMDFFNKKDYLNAYNDLKQVIPEDKKRYDKARDKGNESLTLYINNQITEAKNLAYKLQYQH